MRYNKFGEFLIVVKSETAEQSGFISPVGIVQNVNNQSLLTAMARHRSASDPFRSAMDPLGSKPVMNRSQTGLLPELSKQTPPDPIRTPTDSASDFQSDLLRVL